MFGIRLAPVIFVNALSSFLAGFEGIVICLDDVWRYTRETWKENLQALLKRLAELNFGTWQTRMCDRGSVSLVPGHELDQNGVRLSHERLEKFINCRHPETLGELKSFPGPGNIRLTLYSTPFQH